jgi:hypothetical protein
MLPAPDGPADGCGWDPQEYVVWKNLPRNWATTHFQTAVKPLMAALSKGIAKPVVPRTVGAITDIGAAVRSIVEQWANMNAEPAGSAILQNLWAQSGVGGTFEQSAQQLAQQLQSQLNSSIMGSDITSSTTVDQLIAMV